MGTLLQPLDGTGNVTPPAKVRSPAMRTPAAVRAAVAASARIALLAAVGCGGSTTRRVILSVPPNDQFMADVEERITPISARGDCAARIPVGSEQKGRGWAKIPSVF